MKEFIIAISQFLEQKKSIIFLRIFGGWGIGYIAPLIQEYIPNSKTNQYIIQGTKYQEYISMTIIGLLIIYSCIKITKKYIVIKKLINKEYGTEKFVGTITDIIENNNKGRNGQIMKVEVVDTMSNDKITYTKNYYRTNIDKYVKKGDKVDVYINREYKNDYYIEDPIQITEKKELPEGERTETNSVNEKIDKRFKKIFKKE